MNPPTDPFQLLIYGIGTVLVVGTLKILDRRRDAKMRATVEQSQQQTAAVAAAAVRDAHASSSETARQEREAAAQAATEAAVEASRQAGVYTAEQTTKALEFLAEQMAEMWLEVQTRMDQHARRNDDTIAEIWDAVVGNSGQRPRRVDQPRPPRTVDFSDWTTEVETITGRHALHPTED